MTATQKKMMTLTDCLGSCCLIDIQSSDFFTTQVPSTCRRQEQGEREVNPPLHAANGFRVNINTAVPVDTPDGAIELLQVNCPHNISEASPKLDGDPAFQLISSVLTRPLFFLEIKFIPREVRQYSTQCIFHNDAGKSIRIHLIAVGYDSRDYKLYHIPFSSPQNMLSRCNFTQDIIRVSSNELSGTFTNVLWNQESRLIAHFRLGPFHPALKIFPLEGDVEPRDSVKFAISLKSSESLRTGTLFIPCVLSLRQRASSEEKLPESTTHAGDEEVFAHHSAIPVMQSVSRLICNKGVTGRRSVCDKSTRSRTSKISLEAKMKLFEQTNTGDFRVPDHYIGFHVVFQTQHS